MHDDVGADSKKQYCFDQKINIRHFQLMTTTILQIYDDYGDNELSQCDRFTRKLLELMLIRLRQIFDALKLLIQNYLFFF